MIRTTLAVIGLLAATACASAQQLSCQAGAVQTYGAWLTIEQLREYMANHPSCQLGRSEPKQAESPQMKPEGGKR